MKSYLRLGLTAIAAIIFFNAFAVTETKAQGQGVLNEVLNRMDVHYKALKSLQANVTREQYNSQLKESDSSFGKISLIPGSKQNFALRLDWAKPKVETISVVKGQYVAFIPNIKRAYKGQSNSKTVNDKGGNVLKIMSMSKQDLKTNYNAQYLGQEAVSGNIQTFHLKLTPKAAAQYKYAELWIDGDGMPIQGKVILLNNDTDSVLLSGLQKNVRIKGSIFDVVIPKGTEIIES